MRCKRRKRGREATEIARKSPPSLIVLDVGLPDIDGFEVCRIVRTFSDVPVIFLTSRSDEIDRVVGLEIGGDDYVVKPFSPRELLARIKAIRRRNRPAGRRRRQPSGANRCATDRSRSTPKNSASIATAAKFA